MDSVKPPYSFDVKELDEYRGILQRFIYDVHLIKHIISNFPVLYEKSKEDRKGAMSEEYTKLKPDERDQLKEFMKFGHDMADIGKKEISGTVIMKKGSGTFLEKAIIEVMVSGRIIPFLMEMSLVYLITSFEEFVKKELEHTLKSNLNILKSTKTMTHEELLDLQSMDEIKNEMIRKELEDLLNRDIEDLAKRLDEKFKIDLTVLDDWKKFTECFYRRHSIIHKNGMPDKRYRDKTKYSGPDERLVTDEKYLVESLTIFETFAVKLTDFLHDKYPSTINTL